VAGGLAARLGAQDTGPLVLAGHAVVVRAARTTPLAGAYVVAHRVGPQEQGPIDSMRSGADGGFRFRVAAPDTGAVYVVSTRYDGIGYFSAPISPQDRAGADTIRLAVYDTSTGGAPLDVEVRHLVIASPGADGSRAVLDIAQVGNAGTTTRVAKDSAAATFWMLIPSGMVSFEVGESDVPPSAIRRDADTVLVHAPFPPGHKQIVVSYVIPRGARSVRLPFGRTTARLELLVEDSTARATGVPLVAGNPMELQGRSFRRFSAGRIDAGQAAVVTFGRTGGRHLTWLAVVLAALVLGAGGYAAARRRTGVAPARGDAAAPDGDALLRRIVALDERYAGREAATPPPEWAAYQAQRAALKQQLADRLARR
jgi:hypothetical protein